MATSEDKEMQKLCNNFVFLDLRENNHSLLWKIINIIIVKKITPQNKSGDCKN